jgi:P-type Ca2+ transporter type 2C
VHIVFLELIIDPACSVVFEAEKSEGDVMNRPPRRLDAPLFDRITIVLSILQGFSVLIVTASVFMIAIQRGLGEDEARTLCFTTLILANIGLILTNRSWQTRIWVNITKPNPALWWVIGGALLFLVFVLYLPATQGIFHFSQLNIADVAICLGAAVLSILWFEFIKPVKAKVDSLANATHQR